MIWPVSSKTHSAAASEGAVGGLQTPVGWLLWSTGGETLEADIRVAAGATGNRFYTYPEGRSTKYPDRLVVGEDRKEKIISSASSEFSNWRMDSHGLICRSLLVREGSSRGFTVFFWTGW